MKKQLLTIMLIASSLTSTMVPAAVNQPLASVTDSQTKSSSTPAVNQLSYEHIKEEEFNKIITSLKKAVHTKISKEQLARLWKDYETLYTKADGMYCLAEYRLNQTDADHYYEKEGSYYELLLSKISSQVDETLLELNANGYSKDLKEILGTAKYTQIQTESEHSSKKAQDLEAKIAVLQQQYHKNLSETTITIHKKKYNKDTIYDCKALSKKQLEDYDNKLWDKMDEKNAVVLLELIPLQNKLAKLYGYSSYPEYAYAEVFHRDYTPQSIQTFYGGVKKNLVPVYQKLLKKKETSQSKNKSIDFDQLNSTDTFKKVLTDLSPVLKERFSYLNQHNLLEVTKDPAQGSFCFTTYLPYFNLPLIYINSTKGDSNIITTMIHEFGHWCNCYENPNVDMSYDLLETHSQALELLAIDSYYHVISKEAGDYMKQYVLSEILRSVIKHCVEDEFQQTLYSTQHLTKEKIIKLHKKLSDDYQFEHIQFSGNSITFDSPLYDISYSVSAISSLVIWDQSTENKEKALNSYFQLMKLGTKYPYSYQKLLEADQLPNPFSEDTLKKIAADINKVI